MGFVEVNIAATLRPARVSAPMRDARVTCAPEEAPFSGVSDEGLIGRRDGRGGGGGGGRGGEGRGTGSRQVLTLTTSAYPARQVRRCV